MVYFCVLTSYRLLILRTGYCIDLYIPLNILLEKIWNDIVAKYGVEYTFHGLFYWIMRRGREAAITIQCRLLCYGKTCSWTHVVWKPLLFLQFNVTYVHILSPARLSARRCARASTAASLVRTMWAVSIHIVLISYPFWGS